MIYKWLFSTLALYIALQCTGCIIIAEERTTQPEKSTPKLPTQEEKPSVQEDCIQFNPNKTEVSFAGGRWKIVEGSHWLLDFGPGEKHKREAEQAIRVIKHYRLNKQCFVGRPNPSMTYWLVGNHAPAGAMSGEDAIAFNPANLKVVRIGNHWKIVEGGHHIMDFADRHSEAEAALQIIRKYEFTYICFVGRPNPSMTYFRR